MRNHLQIAYLNNLAFLSTDRQSYVGVLILFIYLEHMSNKAQNRSVLNI